MANVNRVILIGNLTRDPELRYTTTGLAVATFTLAINNRYQDQKGEQKEETDFIRVKVLGKQAENCAKYLNKGRSVYVEGRLQFRTWEAQDGQKKSSLDVVGLNIQFLGKADGSTGKTEQPIAAPADGHNTPPDDDIPF